MVSLWHFIFYSVYETWIAICIFHAIAIASYTYGTQHYTVYITR